MALLGDLVKVDSDASRRSATIVNALEKSARVVDLEIFTLSLYVAEELKLGAGGCDASVAVEYGAGQGIVKEGPGILAATAPFVTSGAASTGCLWGGSRLESLFGIATAGASSVDRIKACGRTGP